MKKHERQEPGPHLTPKNERFETVVDILQIGDDVPIFNDDASELRIYNGPTGERRSYVWDEDAKAWKRKED